jgi:hypothetical protein
MILLLSSDNILDYLTAQKLYNPDLEYRPQVFTRDFKNFNLLVSWNREKSILLKQERPNREGKFDGDLAREWAIGNFFEHFEELNFLSSISSEILNYDRANSILTLNYLENYSDLDNFYDRELCFPSEIASALGYKLASVHKATFDSKEYRDFLQPNYVERPSRLLGELERISPRIFSNICPDGIEFVKLFQRYDSLKKAIAELNASIRPCCLIHKDLRLNNILLADDWEAQLEEDLYNNNAIRLIDWELFAWGDPAFDLGTLISNYLRIWLKSLTIAKGIDVNTALSLASVPLEELQPSLFALVNSYLKCFSQIEERDSDFLTKVIQCAGIVLINKIKISLEYREPFDNQAIVTMQLAKNLLCNPARSLINVLGKTI